MNSSNDLTNGKKTDFSQSQDEMVLDIRAFFKTDSCAEIIQSMNALVETILFSTDLESVTPALRADIANQLRAVSLLSRLNETNYRLRV